MQTHVPNYFFPKIDHYPDLKTAAVVFLASAMSLVMLILLLIVILYRMNHHVREQRELQSQLRTISELLGNLLAFDFDQFNLFYSDINEYAFVDNTTNGQIDQNDESSEQPPAYEHPPDYDKQAAINSTTRRGLQAAYSRIENEAGHVQGQSITLYSIFKMCAIFARKNPNCDKYFFMQESIDTI